MSELSCPPDRRYRLATFDSMLASGNAAFELQTPELGHRKAIVSANQLKGPYLRKGDQLELFLIKLTGAGNWICVPWPKEQNPWLNGSMVRKGDDVAGTVIGFIADWLAIVEISVAGLAVEARLQRDRIPDDEDTDHIKDVLAIGDQIRALVSSVDTGSLRISLDVSAWHAKMADTARRENLSRLRLVEADNHGPAQRLVRSSKILSSHRILIIDDDSRLNRSMDRWLSIFGADVVSTTDPKVFDLEVKRNPPSRILLDYHLAHHDTFETFAKMIVPTKIPAAIFTGSPKAARPRAIALGFGLISKPATLETLREWLDNPEPARAEPIDDDDARNLRSVWAVEAQKDDVVREATSLLDRLCERYHCQGAIWLLEDREGVFEPRARSRAVSAFGLDEALPKLERSVVGLALSQKHMGWGVLPPNDPLVAITSRMGISRPGYVALPIFRENVQPRIVVFFKEGTVDEYLAERVRDRQDHFELLIRAIQQAQHVEQIETFATQGRLAAAALHEARNVLQSIESMRSRIKYALERDDVRDALTKFSVFREDTERLSVILTNGLEAVRLQRRELTNIDGVVGAVVESMQRLAVDEFKKEAVQIFVELSDSKLSTAIPPVPLEQTLVNLIGNSLFFLPNESWAQIKVKVQIKSSDTKTPIHIDVTDNGPGVSANQQLRLFEPRVSAKGRVGTGLGLYVSRNLLKLAGGDLVLQRTIRWGGTTFRVKLPAVFSPMDEQSAGKLVQMPRGQHQRGEYAAS